MTEKRRSSYAERQECGCGSREIRYPLHDGHGIFLCYACENCEAEKLGEFRPDIMESYDASEPIEADY